MPLPFSQAAPRGAAVEPPECFHRLARGEQLVLWSLRALALGHADCPALHGALHSALGAALNEMLPALLVVARTLGTAAAHPLRLHAPGCDGVGEDERRLLSLLADAQQALAEGDERDVKRTLSDIVEPRLVEGLLMHLQAIAAPLEVSGYVLPRRARRVAAASPRRLQ